ncbi:MAG: S-adenosylmethionine:tRNA ribosyltransferase-isomerase, partial [Polyangiaceae bacterium]|nr:S-adenosylmethionine:tRNA ribosyltransferase-isomerase [Polyangiaceae bacterium]
MSCAPAQGLLSDPRYVLGDGTVRIDAFDFELPADRIAQRPVEPRDASRLLVVDPASDYLIDATMRDLPAHAPSNAVLVVNDTRVIRARLLGRKADTGGKVELLLVRKAGEGSLVVAGREHAGERWLAMGKASKAFRFPTRILFGDGNDLFAILETRSEDGLLQVLLVKPGGGTIRESIERLGHVPLPPYIRREDDGEDAERYQTVYARHEGAIAAPTAGLHLTHSLLGALGANGIQLVTLTL